MIGSRLYLIEILHQTTTSPQFMLFDLELYLIEILHQTTTICCQPFCAKCCILSKFYIKPQHHRGAVRMGRCCILSKFYIKPQQGDGAHDGTGVVSYRNSTSNHNCPEWNVAVHGLYLIEILHQTTTMLNNARLRITLYLIEILHQTTTSNRFLYSSSLLYLIEILHQTTTKFKER